MRCHHESRTPWTALHRSTPTFETTPPESTAHRAILRNPAMLKFDRLDLERADDAIDAHLHSNRAINHLHIHILER